MLRRPSPKVMVVSRTGGEAISIYIDGRKVEVVNKFKYLGSWITDEEDVR